MRQQFGELWLFSALQIKPAFMKDSALRKEQLHNMFDDDFRVIEKNEEEEKKDDLKNRDEFFILFKYVVQCIVQMSGRVLVV